jgi:GNAT superfamily N-acetyltransferase
MPTSATTRLGSTADFDAVLGLVRAMTSEITCQPVDGGVDARLQQEVAEALRGDPDDAMVVAERDGILVGCGRVRVLAHHPMFRFGPDSRHAYVELMYVAAPERGSGLGGQILEELERIAVGRGVLDLTLHHSPKARAFYESHGFAPLGEMHKRLARPPSG